MELTHIAADRMGKNGELYRACDGGLLEPLPALYEHHPESPHFTDVRLVFCEECKRVARRVGKKRGTKYEPQTR